MKSSSILCVSIFAAVFCAVTGNVYANPRAAEAPGSNFLVAADNLEGWHVGGFYRYQSRELDHGVDNFNQDTFAFHIGIDLVDWFSLYGFVGTSDVELEKSYYDSDRAVTFGGGCWVNIIDQDILYTLSTETKLRLQACAQISAARPEIGGTTYGYTETYGTVTFSIINEIVGNKGFWPEAVGLFLGPAYSQLECDDFDATGDKVGMIFGLDLYINHGVSFSASYETYGAGDDAVNFSLNCRF